MLSPSLVARLCLLLLAVLASACGDTSDERAEHGEDGKHDSFRIAIGKADVPDTIHEGSPEAEAILRVVNDYSLHHLVADVGLFWRSAHHTVSYRNGRDGWPGTDDDVAIQNLAQLDSVYYVGPSALRLLRAHVREADLIHYGDVRLRKYAPERVSSSGASFAVTIVPGQIVELDLDAEPGDRIVITLSKATAALWNPRIRLVDMSGADDGGRRIRATYNPWGNADVRIPEKAEDLAQGFAIAEGDDLAIWLESTDGEPGILSFELRCVGGPCQGASNEVLDDGPAPGARGDALREQMVAEHELNHAFFDYLTARQWMFGEVDNRDGVVRCVYTGKTLETEGVPPSHLMNAEHTWPQSEGAFLGSARTDLHHLYPVVSAVNSLRGAHPFCEVEEVIREMDGALLGYDASGTRCFEPRQAHKGNAARSLFYFATVYQQSIDPAQEAVLRRWDDVDPIDPAERSRNEIVAGIQGSRNPFVDWTGLAARIDDF